MTIYYEQLNLIDQSLSLVVKMDQSEDIYYKKLEKNYSEIKVYLDILDKESLIKIAEKCTNELILIGKKSLFISEMNTFANLGVFQSIETNGGNVQIEINMSLNNKNSSENNTKLIKQFTGEVEISKTDYFLMKSLLEDANKQISQLKLENAKLNKQNEAIQKQIDQGIFDAKSEQFQLLMEKYKASTERLNNLRKSRLGKLQIKYWDYKGR